VCSKSVFFQRKCVVRSRDSSLFFSLSFLLVLALNWCCVVVATKRWDELITKFWQEPSSSLLLQNLCIWICILQYCLHHHLYYVILYFHTLCSSSLSLSALTSSHLSRSSWVESLIQIFKTQIHVCRKFLEDTLFNSHSHPLVHLILCAIEIKMLLGQH